MHRSAPCTLVFCVPLTLNSWSLSWTRVVFTVRYTLNSKLTSNSNRRSPTAEDRVQHRTKPCGICGIPSRTGQYFSFAPSPNSQPLCAVATCSLTLLSSSDVYWTAHRLDNRTIQTQLDVTYYFIVLLIDSTCFGHYCAHHQELATVMLITTLVVSFLVCCRLEVRCFSLQPGHYSSPTAPNL